MPVHNLDSLQALGRHLEKIEGRRPTRRQKPAESSANGPGSSFRDRLLAARASRAKTTEGDAPPTFLYQDAPTNSNERRR